MRAFAVAVGIVLAVVFASLSALRTAALLASPVRPVGDILTGLVSGLLAITFLGAALRAARHGNALMHPATRKAFRCIAKGMRARDWGVSAGELPFSGWREYPLLAESAVLLSEGDEQLARKRLVEWKVAMSSGGGRFAAVGNHWALDILTERLQVTATSK